MPFYENVFIARQDISATQVDALTDGFSKTIEDLGGTVSKREYWGLRSLAYKIKKNRKGHYVLMNIDAQTDAVHEMERQMRISEDVLRYLTVKIEEIEEGPSVVMQGRGGRDDRPRRTERADTPTEDTSKKDSDLGDNKGDQGSENDAEEKGDDQ
jgi:small subunit ribosomal protein S6